MLFPPSSSLLFAWLTSASSSKIDSGAISTGKPFLTALLSF